ERETPADRDELLRQVDELMLSLTNVASQLGVLVNVHPDLEAREACEAIQIEATKLSVQVGQSRPIFDALSKIDLAALAGPARRDMGRRVNYPKDASARLALSRAYYARARGNTDVLAQLRAARHELATTLGYKTFADYNLEDTMVGTPAALDRFLDDVRAAAKDPAERQYAALREISRREDPSATGIGQWDLQYYLARAKDERFKFDPREVRPYLEYRAVR